MNRHADTKRKPLTLQTVERALGFLEAVAIADRPPKVNEVATQLGLNITTAYHLMNTLHEMRYVARDGDGRLRVGGRVALLYEGMRRQLDLGADFRNLLGDLARETGETAYLSGYDGRGVVIRGLVEGSHAVRVRSLDVGYGGAEHLRASGKAVLAFLDAEESLAVIERSAKDLSARQRKALASKLDTEFAEIRISGYATDDEIFEQGVYCVSAPFFMSDGSVLGSLGISMPTERATTTASSVTASVRSHAHRVSAVLGFDGSTRD